MLKLEEKMKDKLEQLGYEYYKRSGVWIKYKDWFMETIIFYNYTSEVWEGYLAFRTGVISSREKLEECTEIIKSRYEELEKELEILKECED
jgi:hypothetical protein